MDVIKLGKIKNNLFILIPEIANFKYSLTLKDLLQNEKDYTNIVLSMGDTKYIDSSFIGVLLFIGLMVVKEKKNKVIIFANEYIKKILTKYQMSSYFEIKVEKHDFNNIVLEEIQLKTADEKQYLISVLEDHRLLSSISERNREAFTDLIKSLEKELEKK